MLKRKLSGGGIAIKTEQSKDRIINSVEEAAHVICATAYSHQLTVAELKEFKGVVELAKHFDMNLDSIVLQENPNEADRRQGYWHVYSFPSGEEAAAVEDPDKHNPFGDNGQMTLETISKREDDRRHALHLYSEGLYKECIDFVDGLYGWAPGELNRELEMEYDRDHAYRTLVAFGIDREQLV